MKLNRTLSFLMMLTLVSLPLTKGAHFLSVGKSGLNLCCSINSSEKQAKHDCCTGAEHSGLPKDTCSDTNGCSSCKGCAPCCLSFAGDLEKAVELSPNTSKTPEFSTLSNSPLADFSQDIFQPPKFI